MLQIGGHHMAYNITYRAGVGYPVPHHLGVEPREPFTVSGNYAGTYQPLVEQGNAMHAIFSDFNGRPTERRIPLRTNVFRRSSRPLEYATGSEANVVYPTQSGVLVSSLTTAQQELVTTAIKAWVQDYDPSIADALLREYTSAPPTRKPT